ncbi:MAG: DUF2306 domain-containing protein [Kangiellaceae bacterium]|nr:DUF2306 domain-containing protein [Kangiellaceae bacterium]
MLAIIHQILFYIHIACGSIGLVIFWVPMLAKKGAKLHINTGKIFSNGMMIVSVSGLLMSAFLLLDPVGVRYPNGIEDVEMRARVIEQNRTLGIFLMMLSLLVFVNVKHSILVLKAKSDRSKLRTADHLGSVVALFLAGIAVGLLALSKGNILFGIFSILSIVSSIGLMRYIYKKELKPREWLIEHLGNIIGSGIGAYTAFFAFGGRRLFSDIFVGQMQLIPWILPGIVGAIASIYLAKKYRKVYRIS